MTGSEGVSTEFRSVLPHEPLPKETLGYLHVQGAFMPKKSQASESESNQEFWTKESLQEALSDLFSKLAASPVLSSPVLSQVPFATQGVAVLDNAPPFTKVRIVFSSPRKAYHNMILLRRMKLSPVDLFHGFSDAQFGGRPLQVTQVTTERLPALEQAWPRSNPPKFRRLIARPGEDPILLEQERRQTRFVFVSNLFASSDASQHVCWSDPHCVTEAIRAIANRYDSSHLGVEVYVSVKKVASYCHVGMRCNADAQALMAALQGQQVTWEWMDENDESQTIESGYLFVDYAAITQRSAMLATARTKGEELPKGDATRSECTSSTAHVTVPGLFLVPDFVSADEERVLLAVLTGPHAPWAPAQATPTAGHTVKRRVQHYGYVFDYQTANVLRDRTTESAQCPPVPSLETSEDLERCVGKSVDEGDGWMTLAGIIERTRRHEFDLESNKRHSFPSINQVTVNEYAPGEGIGSHVDTPSAFGDGLISISLNGGIVMEFRKVNASEDEDYRKLVYLPPRSMLLMSGPARYQWEHMIVTRKTDTVDGEIMERKLRISLTLRTALDENGLPMALVASSSFPPVWGTLGSPVASLATPACEREHVHAVYDAIATQWHHTRGRRGVLWPGATQFLQRLEPGSVVADVGCGDGKYFPVIWEAGSFVIGTDMSLPLLKTAALAPDEADQVPEIRRVSDHRRHFGGRPAVAVADCMNIPLRRKSVDAAICIAVLHHISTPERRKRCVEELVRIVKPGGTINIQAWAMEQEESSRRKFAANDVFVPFNAQPKYLTLGDKSNEVTIDSKSTAQVYSEAFNAEYDDRKGLVVFQRYCHLYKKGELEQIISQVEDAALVESGFGSGNHFVILEVLR